MNHVGGPGEKKSPFFRAELEKLGFDLICYKPADFHTEDRIAIAVKKSEFEVLETKFIDLREAAKEYRNKEKYITWGYMAILCLMKHTKT